MGADLVSDPTTPETTNRLKAYAEHSPDGNITLWSKGQHTGEDGQYTPERQAVHQKILGELFNPNAKAKPGQKPIAVMLMGPPAAGKTSAGAPMMDKFGVEFTTLNPDDVKERLPEYQGWNAALLHEESSDVAEEMLTKQALSENHNVLYDVTGKNDNKMAANVEKLAALGYDVHIANVQAPSHVVGWRAWGRYRKAAFAEDKGRFVPPDYAAKAVNGKPGGTYDRLKQMPAVKSWLMADTSAFETGGGPQVLEQGAR